VSQNQGDKEQEPVLAKLTRYFNRSLSTSANTPLPISKIPFPKHPLLLQLRPTPATNAHLAGPNKDN